MTTNDFDNADFYDCQDSEDLTCTTPEEALEEYIDGWTEVGDSLEAVIRKYSPIIVVGYRRKTISDGEMRREIRWSVDEFVQRLTNEYGDPDGGPDSSISTEAIEVLIDTIFPTIRETIDEHFLVWACESVGKREYNADEVIALMREHRPDWFEEARHEQSL